MLSNFFFLRQKKKENVSISGVLANLELGRTRPANRDDGGRGLGSGSYSFSRTLPSGAAVENVYLFLCVALNFAKSVIQILLDNHGHESYLLFSTYRTKSLS